MTTETKPIINAELADEEFGPPDHVEAMTDARNIVENFEPLDCDENDIQTRA